jgi:hypothetical protein
MKQHLASVFAVIVMVVLAFGSMDTSINSSQKPKISTRDVPAPSPTKSDELPSSVIRVPADSDVDGGGLSVATPIVHTMKETVHVGYTSYAVWKAWWSDQLSSNEFLNQRPNASYLFLEVSVRNDDRKARIVPPFKLIDETGAEYDTSPQGWAVEGSIGLIESLNPGVSKRGFVVFDVPKNHTYRLKISGGYWSTEDALVEIVDETQEVRERERKEAEQRAKREEEKREADEAREFEIDTKKWRVWLSANGKHRQHAKFIQLVNNVVTLETREGKKIKVRLDQLSEKDQTFIKDREWLKPIGSQ